MRILSLYAENFRAYTSLSWVIPASGLYLIDAESDTGRSNMCGKTTMLDAVFWAAYGWLPKWGGPKGGSSDAVIKRGTSGCKVILEVENDGSHIKIVRQRPSKSQLFVDGKEVHGKASDLDDKIETLIGMTPAQFLLSILIAQDRTTSFYTMSDAERTNLLSIIAGLEELDKGLLKAKQRKELAQSGLDKIEGSLNTLKEQYDAIPVRHNALKVVLADQQAKSQEAVNQAALISRTASRDEGLATERYHASLLANRTSRDSKLGDLTSSREGYASRLLLLSSQLGQNVKVEQHYQSAIIELKEKIKEAEAHNLQQEKIRQRNEKRTEQVSQILDQAEKANTGKCNSCNQELPIWDREAHSQRHLEKAQKIVAEMEVERDLLEVTEFKSNLENALQAYERRKIEIEAAPNQIRLEIAATKANLATIDAQIAAINSEFNSLNAQHEAELLKTKSELEQIVRDSQSELKQYGMLINQTMSSIKDIREQNDRLEAIIEENKVKSITLIEEMNQALDLIELFGPKGIRSVSFDGLIERIGQRANQLFGVMTDGLYGTRLEQIGTDSKGNNKLILKPTITKGGQEVYADDLSGGARRMAMLAYDIAVSETISGSAPLFLDESLDGLDTVGKGEAMRLLESVARVRPVFVIDHSSEFKSSFNQVLTVKHKNGDSFLGEEVKYA